MIGSAQSERRCGPWRNAVIFCLQELVLAITNRVTFPSSQFWALVMSVVVLFVMGGSSRADVQSLVLLNPLLVLGCGAALVTLQRNQLQESKWFLASFLLILLLIAVYVVPSLMQAADLSAGVEYLSFIREATDPSGSLPTLFISPAMALQTFAFMFAPLAVFLFAIQLNRDDLRKTLPLIIAVGTISGIFGVLQIAGSADGPFYFYRVTNNGAAVGLFANRNHAAVFLACIFPILALFAASSPTRIRGNTTFWRLIAIAIAIILVPLILVTGSRSGMLSAFIGLIGGSLLYSSHTDAARDFEESKSLGLILSVTIISALIFATIFFSRAEAIERIFAEPNTANDRLDFWTSSLQIFWRYFPYGFGPGGFVPAFQIDEPLNLLGAAYLNRLHNDWLETALTFGLPGILFLLTCTIYYVRRSFFLWMRMDGARSAVALGRMASIVILILATASVSDYPLRTPAMAGFATLVLVWFAHARRKPNPSLMDLPASATP